MNNKVFLIGVSILAFLVALLLVIAIAKLLLGGRLRMPGGRTRQARLGIVDAFDLDRQRQLIIVRRDNTEHLIMIGGPNDLLIEAEIVRMEARDPRGRVDKLPEPNPAVGDRIPAPFAPVGRSEPLAPSDAPVPRPEEPLPPMPLPVVPIDGAPVAPMAAGPARAPTFPLPPRRPSAAPVASPERGPPAPPRLPDTIARDDAPPFANPMPSLANQMPSLANQVPPPPGLVPANQVPPPEGQVPAAQVPPQSPGRPPFLKPLPPRPPIRPLKRVTPQAQPDAPAAPTVAAPPPTPPLPVAPPAAPAPVVATAPPPPAPALPAPKPAEPKPVAVDSTGEADSLEEEMAKLLGRGPGG